MLRKFYEKVLPDEGVYCVTGIDSSAEPPKVRNYFCDTKDQMFETIERVKSRNHNVFVALSTFNEYTRKADNAIWCRSFFVDLDVGDSKDYHSKEEALQALDAFLEKTGLPQPVRVDSGRGVHAYWPFEIAVESEEWKTYAEKFKSYCLDNGLHIDRAVTADAARILRAPDTLNYKEDPPLPTSLIDEEINLYVFEEFKDFLGVEEAEPSLDEILAMVPKGDLTDDQKAMMKLDNFETTFERIAIRSLEGDGCAQIKEILINPNGISYDMWLGGLSIAGKCDDGETAIHKMSEDYEGYSYENTVKKAFDSGIEGARRCEWFAQENPSKCEGCPHRGKISSPIQLGKSLKVAALPVEKTEGAVWTPQSALALPEALHPFQRGINGGIYYTPPPTMDKKTKQVTVADPVLISQYDLYPIKRIYSPLDGECLLLRTHLPNDGIRDFMMPMKTVYAQERFKEVMASNGVFMNPLGNGVQYLMTYIYKWGSYLEHTMSADIIRSQMGWTDESRQSFVLGTKEYKKDGTIIDAPISSLCRKVANMLKCKGSYDEWKLSMEKLSNESMEVHAFALLCGFGSIFMNYTSTPGVTLGLSGTSGAAKTGAMYAALSIWGDPQALSVATNEGATANALVGRYLALHNLPFAIDEIGNIKPDLLSNIILKVSSGQAKLKMQASVNAERDYEANASLIAFMTANGDLYDKLGSFKGNPEGEVARLIELKSYGVPKYLEKNTRMGPYIFDRLKHNHGWAGPDFIKNVLANYNDDEIKPLLDAEIEKFKNDFGDFGPYRFYENTMAVAMVACDMLREFEILDLPKERIYNVMVTNFLGIKDGARKISDVDYESLIGSFINQHATNMLAIKDGKVSMDPRGPLYIRADIDKSLLSINLGEFNKFLAERQVSSRELIHHLQTKGISTVKKRVRMGAGWKDAMAAFNDNCYQFDSVDMFKLPIPDGGEVAND